MDKLSKEEQYIMRRLVLSKQLAKINKMRTEYNKSCRLTMKLIKDKVDALKEELKQKKKNSEPK